MQLSSVSDIAAAPDGSGDRTNTTDASFSMLLEQAIFTSLKTRHQEGYQLAACSQGVTSEQAKELEHWGPAHDSLVINDFGSTSINFHPLESGEYCISKTTAAGDEYSARGGPRIFTQMLIVPSEVLARFANQPLAIIEALTASGKLDVPPQIPPQLPTLPLIGKASLLQPLRIAELLGDLGIEKVLQLVQLALDSPRLAVRSHVSLERVYGVLLMLLPLRFRPQFSFSTGLRSSPRRPFRLLALSPDTAEQRNLERSSGARLLDLTRRELPPLEKSRRGWAYLLRDVFESRQLAVLPELLRRANLYDEVEMTLDEVAQRVEDDVQAEA